MIKFFKQRIIHLNLAIKEANERKQEFGFALDYLKGRLTEAEQSLEQCRKKAKK